MSVRKVSSSTLPYTTGLGTSANGPNPVIPWVRNKSWLSFTAPTSSEEKFIGLHAVWPESNFLALSASGNYTVNWGDGLIENFSAGVTAQHEYDFADVDLANTNAPVTLQGAADTVTRSSHGYNNGDIVKLYNIVTTTGISANNPYYVISATANTFQLSLTPGGAAIDLVTDGSATLLPYKQAIVQVYPQAGQSFTALNLNIRHSSLSTLTYTSGFLDIALAGASLTSFALGVPAPNSSPLINFYWLNQVNIVRTDCRQLTGLFYFCYALQSILGLGTSTDPATTVAVTFTDSTDTVNATAHGFRNGDPVIFSSIVTTTGITTYNKYYVLNATANTFQVSTLSPGTAIALTNNGSGVALRGTDMTNLFNSCFSLLSVPLFNTAAVTAMGNMFLGCSALTSVPLFNTSAVTSMSSMFQGCTSITSVPLFNTAAVTNMGAMFSGCFSLQSVPLFNTAAVTSMQLMFNGCRALRSVPLFNTAAVTNMNNMFASCFYLQSVPLFNTAAVTTMSSMFTSCVSLQSVPLLNTSAVTNMSGMFNSCTSLASVPLFNTAAVTAMGSMFQNCLVLPSVPLFNIAALTTISSMFNGCSSLQSVPALNVTGLTSFASMFNSCSNLSRIQATSFRFSFSVASCKLSATALNEIYTNLPTVTAQTITVTGNYGTATDNPAIATAKGWTVTG